MWSLARPGVDPLRGKLSVVLGEKGLADRIVNLI